MCDERFSAVREALAESLDDDVGASAAVYLDGELVADLWDGFADAARTIAWERDTITCVWSTTKTMLALCALIRGQGPCARAAPAGPHGRPAGFRLSTSRAQGGLRPRRQGDQGLSARGQRNRHYGPHDCAGRAGSRCADAAAGSGGPSIARRDREFLDELEAQHPFVPVSTGPHVPDCERRVLRSLERGHRSPAGRTQSSSCQVGAARPVSERYPVG